MKIMQSIAMAISLIALAEITGCATANTYQSTPTSKLCLDYLTLPSANFNHGARAEELARRGESCSSYGGAAALRQKADSAMQNTLNQMMQSTTPATPAYQQGTHVYSINGRMVTCTTTGNITNCQ